jgi:nitroreductase
VRIRDASYAAQLCELGARDDAIRDALHMRGTSQSRSGGDLSQIAFEQISELIQSRRTSLPEPDRALPLTLVRELCELARWAPNHRRSWPWRFAAFVGPGRARLGHAFAEDLRERSDAGEVAVAKARTKYQRAPAIVVAASAPHTNPEINRENLHAVAAGVQNLLLAATAAGLASFWASPPDNASPRVLSLCGFESDSHIVGVIYLGWPSRTVTVPQRPSMQVRVVDQ